MAPKPLPEGKGGFPVPSHVAIIMDGNGRWAAMRGLPRIAGHRAGADAVSRCLHAARDAGVDYLTLYAFSSENWRRGAAEVADLTSLLRYYLRYKVAELHRENVRICFIGETERFGQDLVEELERTERLTAGNTGLTLVLALSYGGRAEIAGAARRLAEAVRDGKIEPSAVTEDVFSRYLLTAGMPDPDLIVRTSGEHRLSNFLLWQSAYSEFVFLDVLWPDFDESHFSSMLKIYASRERRFGGRPG